MKKTLFTASLALAMTAFAAPALADTESEAKNSLYAAATLTDTFLDDDNVAIKIGYNRSFADVLAGFSVDAELTWSIIDKGSRDNTDVQLFPAPPPSADNTPTEPEEISYFSAASFARYDLSLDRWVSDVGVYGRVGGAYSAVEFAGDDSSSFDPAYGGGLTYSFTPKTAVFADYTVIGGDVEFGEISVGIKASF